MSIDNFNFIFNLVMIFYFHIFLLDKHLCQHQSCNTDLTMASLEITPTNQRQLKLTNIVERYFINWYIIITELVKHSFFFFYLQIR